MKLRILICTLVVMLFSVVTNAYAVSNAEVPIELVVNGYYIRTGDTPPIKLGNTEYVPLKLAARSLGSDAVWNDEKDCIHINVDSDTVIELYTNYGIVHSSSPDWSFDGGYTIINDTAYVPSKLLVYMLGGDVYWDTAYYNVVIHRNNVNVPSELINTFYSDNELYWLSRIIQAESGGEPFAGKVAVGNVIVNRVDSADFPDSIIDVIFDTKYGVQFQPVKNGAIYNSPSYDSVIAAKKALRGDNVAGNSLYFLNPRTASNNWIVQNRFYFTSIGNHDFYL